MKTEEKIREELKFAKETFIVCIENIKKFQELKEKCITYRKQLEKQLERIINENRTGKEVDEKRI